MIWNVIVMALVLAGPFVGVGDAYAWNQSWAPAAVCTMGLGTSSSPNLIPGLSGDVVNRGTTAQGMVCGVGQDEGATTDHDDAIVFYNDVNGASGADIECRAQSSNDTMTVIFVDQRKFSCSTAGGCTFAPLNFTGSGHLRLDVNHGPGRRIAISCRIPGSSGGFLSQIRTISLVQP
jgi:hypothetical protein